MLFGKDLMITKQELPNGTVELGQTISCAVGEGRTGPVAVNVQFPQFPHASLRTPRSARGTYQGVIKSFNATKGWGFVSSDQILEQFGKDMMITKAEFPDGADVGQEVSFTIKE